MKIAIFSHCTIDEISRSGTVVETAGGPPCYCGLTARNFKFDVELYTKIGPDFTYRELLDKNKIFITQRSITETPTTRFALEVLGTNRNLYLKTRCLPIEYEKSDADGCIISPVFDEISHDTFEKLKKDFKFTLLDPQGFLRRTDEKNKIYLQRTEMDLTNISAIKVDMDEAYSLTGLEGREAMKYLQKKGVEHVMLTNKQEITVLVKDKLYFLKIPNMDVYDTTGVGDIFCATFACTYLKEKDFFWAMCFAVGSAQAALETRATGLEKIPHRGAIETNASYLYNLVKYTQI
ncbi:MAG: PfkB family carbohydrate kinase [Nitrosopumilaceae archaeon]